MTRTNLLRQHGSSLIWATVVIWLGYFAKSALVAFAGRTSIGNFIVNLAGHLDLAVSLSLAAAGGSTLLWWLARRSHQKEKAKLLERTIKLEQLIDPNRSSSLLNTDGTTRKGDL